MLWLLDTNVCIDLLRGRTRGRRLPSLKDCRLSSVVVAELWTGANKAAEPAEQKLKVRTFVELFEVEPFDAQAAERYGEIRAVLEKAGTPIGSMDMLIAAQALRMGATLVTANLREFRRVPGLKCHAWE